MTVRSIFYNKNVITNLFFIVPNERNGVSEKVEISPSRVHPETYLEIKDVLVSECARSNGLRLADARPLVKIDVNKTRKLFDFLIKKDLIFLPKVQNDVKMEI